MFPLNCDLIFSILFLYYSGFIKSLKCALSVYVPPCLGVIDYTFLIGPLELLHVIKSASELSYWIYLIIFVKTFYPFFNSSLSVLSFFPDFTLSFVFSSGNSNLGEGS